jgi:alcohol dehydrogenase
VVFSPHFVAGENVEDPAQILIGLTAFTRAGRRRVVPVRLCGDVQADAASLRAAAGGGAQIAFDMVGRAGDASATLASLNSLSL